MGDLALTDEWEGINNMLMGRHSTVTVGLDQAPTSGEGNSCTPLIFQPISVSNIR